MKTGAAEIARAKRRAKALELRKRGFMLKSIAAELGVSVPSAYRDVVEGIAEITREPAEELLALELARLDGLSVGLYPLALAGKVVAIDCLLNIMDRRARLLGLYGASQRGAGRGGTVRVVEI